LGKRYDMKKLKNIPLTVVRMGKAWGQTTDRHIALRSLNTFFYITGMLVVLTGTTFGLLSLIPQKPTPAKVTQTEVPDTVLSASEILRLVNKERKANKLHELNEDTRLNAIAQQRLDDMVKNQYYAHVSPNGKYFYELLPEHMITAKYSCENLDIEFTLDERVYVNNWLNSTRGHRECMLNSEVTSAGYAAGLFSVTSETKIYLVVAIHTTSISKIKTPTPTTNSN
jgi:uncharacterized protein YkwD